MGVSSPACADLHPLDGRDYGRTAVYGTDLPADRLREALASAAPERTPEWRA